MRKPWMSGLIALTLACAAPVAGQEAADLAKQAQNPIANLISLPFQNNTNFRVGPLDRTQNTRDPYAPMDSLRGQALWHPNVS